MGTPLHVVSRGGGATYGGPRCLVHFGHLGGGYRERPGTNFWAVFSADGGRPLSWMFHFVPLLFHSLSLKLYLTGAAASGINLTESGLDCF